MEEQQDKTKTRKNKVKPMIPYPNRIAPIVECVSFSRPKRIL